MLKSVAWKCFNFPWKFPGELDISWFSIGKFSGGRVRAKLKDRHGAPKVPEKLSQTFILFQLNFSYLWDTLYKMSEDKWDMSSNWWFFSPSQALHACYLALMGTEQTTQNRVDFFQAPQRKNWVHPAIFKERKLLSNFSWHFVASDDWWRPRGSF